ncbi:hypothetical protein ACQKWADRAFT_307733 [Trichoderma austrokoningii]
MAVYLAELAFLTAPVSSCVPPADLHNQSVNSMALVVAACTANLCNTRSAKHSRSASEFS